MAWVVDTCVLLDVLEDDPCFGKMSATCLQHLLDDGLIVSPISFIELSPAFGGNLRMERDFLNMMCAVCDEPWRWEETLAAHQAWAWYVRQKQMGKISKRPIADILIGAFARRFQGLVTRNDKDFVTLFPDMKIIVPSFADEASHATEAANDADSGQ